MSRSHATHHLEAEMRALRASTLAMGARCERILGLALDAFWRGAREVDEEVRVLDGLIRRDEMEVEELVLRAFALREPASFDRRVLGAALGLVTDLGRIRDDALKIAERAQANQGEAFSASAHQLRAVAARTEQMVHDALDAFVEGGSTSAAKVIAGEREVGEPFSRTLREMMAFTHDNPGQIAAAVSVTQVAKYLERIGYHATNIAVAVLVMERREEARGGTGSTEKQAA